jgi:hypothetical protein
MLCKAFSLTLLMFKPIALAFSINVGGRLMVTFCLVRPMYVHVRTSYNYQLADYLYDSPPSASVNRKLSYK